MTSYKFQPGERVLVMGAPYDVKASDRGVELFVNLPGAVVSQIEPRPSGSAPRYIIHLDEHLHEAGKYGWITNDYTIEEDDLRLDAVDAVDEDELMETLGSIMTAIEHRNAARS